MRLSIDRHSPLPLHGQLTEQIRLLIDSGELEPGDPLPTIKEAARELAVNSNTVAAAYRALEQEGYLTQRKRAGTAVAASPPRRLERALAGRVAAEAVRRASAAGVAPSELVRAFAAQGALDSPEPRLRVAVLAGGRARASEYAARAGAALGEGFECVPLVPEEYSSVDYHLTIVDPRLTDRLRDETRQPSPRSLPAYLSYGPDFPAAAD